MDGVKGPEAGGGTGGGDGLAPAVASGAGLARAAAERVRAAFGPQQLAALTPVQLAEAANDALEGLVAGRPDKPSLADQRQILREIVAALETRLAKFKQPKRVLFVEDLPRNAMGKVQKKLLV